MNEKNCLFGMASAARIIPLVAQQENFLIIIGNSLGEGKLRAVSYELRERVDRLIS